MSTFTNEAVAVEHRLYDWVRSYFSHRSAPDLFNPKDDGEPLKAFFRLLEEYDTIFDKLFKLSTTPSIRFLRWSRDLLHITVRDCLWKNRLRFDDKGNIQVLYQVSAQRACQIVKAWEYLIRELDWNDDPKDLFRELSRAYDAATQPPMRLLCMSKDALLERIAGLAAAIQEMRPFLVRNFHAGNTVGPIGKKFLGWDWITVNGIGQVVIGASSQEVFEELHAHRTSFYVRADGILASAGGPWMTAETLAITEQPGWLAVNCQVLELCHDKIRSMFDKVDLATVWDRLRKREARDSAPLDDEEIALSCQRLADCDPEAPAAGTGGGEATLTDAELPDGEPVPFTGAPTEAGPTKSAPIDAAPSEAVTAETESPSSYSRPRRPLRLPRLLGVLETQLGCEVQPGKGSEITVYRPGGKKFTLGRHQTHYTVPWPVVKQVLKRLNIGPEEWLDAVAA
jgi:hypothetical protein